MRSNDRLGRVGNMSPAGAKARKDTRADAVPPLKKSRSGPSGWARYNKSRQEHGRIDAYVRRPASVVARSDGVLLKESSSEGSKPTTRDVASQTDLVNSSSTRKTYCDACVGEHVSGEPFLWRGIFDLP